MPWRTNDNLIKISEKFQSFTQYGHKVQQLIMPIVAIADNEIIPLGTGFIVNKQGLLITAKHIFNEFENDRLKKNDGRFYKSVSVYVIHLTDKQIGTNNFGCLIPLSKVQYEDQLDIAFCTLKKITFNNTRYLLPGALSLTFDTPQLGEHILGFGYHKNNGKIKRTSYDKSNIEYTQEANFTEGIVSDIFPQKRDSINIKYPSFQTNAHFASGMSGGPVFNEKGNVCGIISTSFEFSESTEDLSYVSLLFPSLGMDIEVRDTEKDSPYNIPFIEVIKKGLIHTNNNMSEFNVEKVNGKINIQRNISIT